MAVLAQGTQIYFKHPTFDSLGPAIVAVECATTFTPGGNPKDQIETTCLEDTVRAYLGGLRTPGQASMGINADPTNESHIIMHELSEDDPSPVLDWYVGWSDGTSAPTLDTNEEVVLPEDRTWFTFQGYISDFPFDFAQNTVVTSTLTIQRSGGSAWIPKEAA